MKLLVPLRMAWIDSIWLADRHWLMAAMIGMPPATDASKAIERPSSRARSNSSGPCSASRALLAVTTSLPLSNSSSTIVRAGSSPPTSRATAEIFGSPVIRFRSSLTTLARQGDLALLLQVVHHDRPQHDPPSGVARNPIAMLHEQPGHARADRAQSDDGNVDDLHQRTAQGGGERTIVESAAPGRQADHVAGSGDKTGRGVRMPPFLTTRQPAS